MSTTFPHFALAVYSSTAPLTLAFMDRSDSVASNLLPRRHAMSTEANKELLRRWWDALSQGNAVEVVDDFYAADYVLHDPSQPEPVHGLEGVRAFIGAITTGFPD